ncbi:MAG: guanylate kinase [Tenericutes bacterium]|nr:guanylate kinase [Mycoplasmatota bacterium]
MIKENEQGILIVVSGPSGCGKSTLNQLIVSSRKDTIISISDTTRKPREGEKNNVDYNFISKDEFIENITNGKYIEYAIVHSNNYYGTPLDNIDKNLSQGINVILEIDIEGARKVKENKKDAVFIFIMPPSMQILKSRLISRKTETKEQIVERFKKAYQEINEVSKYNYVIVNEDINESIEKMNSIIKCEKCRVDRIEDIYLGNQEEIIHEILMDFEQKEN